MTEQRDDGLVPVHPTMLPNPILVPPDEAVALRAQGLLREDTPDVEPVPLTKLSAPAPAETKSQEAKS